MGQGTIINCRGVVYAVQMPSGRIRDFTRYSIGMLQSAKCSKVKWLLLFLKNSDGMESKNSLQSASPDQLSVAESPPLSPVAQSPVQMPVITSPLPPLRRSSRKRAPRTMLQLDGKKCYKKEQPYQ
uniref:Uncharacterized protein n=1 Tax=Ditylenchus dipsaci TaxID=166011 RepID=A0A915EFE2_9BILA